MRMIGKIAFASVSMLALATPAWAAEAEDDGASASNEIIVQARRKDESVQDVPLVVQAVTGSDLQKMEIRQVEDIAKVVPGLQLQGNASGFGVLASMRGIDFSANASGSATSVEFYRNDVPTTGSAVFQATYDVGQIEVLRGPQGTLRGRASPSGSITITTRRPDLSEVGGYVSGTLSDAHSHNANFALNVPIVADKLAIRVAGIDTKNRGNRVKGLNRFTGDIDSNIFDKRRALRASIRANPFDDILILDFNYETIDTERRFYEQVQSLSEVSSTGGASPVTVTAKQRLGITPMPGTVKANFKIYNWQAQLNLFNQSLTYVGAQTNSKTSSLLSDDLGGVLSSGFTASGNPFGQGSDGFDKSSSHEIRLQNQERLLGFVDYVAGALFTKAETPTYLNRPVFAAASGSTLLAVSYLGLDRFRKAKEESYFGNLTVHPVEGLELSGGLRKIKSSQDSGVAIGGVDSLSSHRCFGYSSMSYDRFTSAYDFSTCAPARKATIYNLGAKYNINSNLMVYATYGTSWRAGNSIIGFRGLAGPFLNQFLELANEKSKSIEGGFKSTWLDGKLKANVSVYHQKFTNYPYRLGTGVIALAAPGVPSIASPFQFVAPTDAKIDGFDLELGFEPSDAFSFGANITYANGKIKGATLPCVDLNNDNLPDQTLPSATDLLAHVGTDQVDTCTSNLSPSTQPKWAASAQAEFRQPINDGMDGFLRTLVSYKGKNPGDRFNQFDQVGSFALIDLFAGVRAADGSWDVTLFAKNLFDSNKVLFRTANPQVAVINNVPNTSTNYLGITTTAPREFGLTVKFAFGSR